MLGGGNYLEYESLRWAGGGGAWGKLLQSLRDGLLG